MERGIKISWDGLGSTHLRGFSAVVNEINGEKCALLFTSPVASQTSCIMILLAYLLVLCVHSALIFSSPAYYAIL